ncbi:MAG: class I SAM-dependent methyltransferase [Dehalococcoidia bacterium]|nr:class I SAM-dependent methyltransferase [Dehalococcoidia bacterium]
MVDSSDALPDLRDPNILSIGYNAVYTATPHSATLRRLWHELAEGLDFPEDFGHISFVTLPQLRRIAAELRLGPGGTLVDLGCGRAGPALWVARELGAQLIGVDFAAVAVEQAGARAAALGLAGQARFVVGTFADTGLDPESADGAMSEDALQYAPDKRAAVAEAGRILRRGARMVFTAFELEPGRAAGLPVFGSDPVDDYRPLLSEAGFAVEAYEEVPGWPEPMTATYSALVSAGGTLAQEMGPQAAAALLTELSMTLQQQPYRRRVLVVATKR